MIAVDAGKDRVSQGDPRRHVQFDFDATRVDGEPRRLQVLVAPMRRHLADTGDAGQYRRQDQQTAGTITSW